MVKPHYIALLFLIVISGFSFSQPRLEISPDDIEFEDIFNRLENVYFKNIGNQPLIVDSIKYKADLYFIRFDRPALYPFIINPGDSVKMDCILAGYYYVPSADTLDTLYVYSNSVSGREDIKVKIDYFDDNGGEGIINGQVTDSIGGIIQGANVYFFYEGNYIIHKTITDQFGFYSALLPPGSYTVAAEKDSYYVTFFGQKFDPLNADFIILEDDSIRTAYIQMPRLISTLISVSGAVYDSTSGSPLLRGVVIVRNGKHNPTKSNNSFSNNPVTSGIYTTFIKPNGTYQINSIVEPDYYFIQSFSDYYVPSYYSTSGYSPSFWQLADSIFIDSQLTNRNIQMPRDSSVGGGNAIGSVSLNTRLVDSISGVIIYAQSVGGSSLINYALISNENSFKVPFLPYGQYQLVGQKIGYQDGYSNVFTIDLNNTSVGDLNITLTPTSVDDDLLVPDNIVILYNYPNPFNPSTTLEYFLPETGKVILRILNMLGEEVAVLEDGISRSGIHKKVFNASGLSSGTYFALLITEKGTATRKILLIK